MSSSHLQLSIEERELDLALREAEVNRRESAVRRAEESRAGDEEGLAERGPSALEDELATQLAAVERRERELARTVEAVDAQRQRLEAIQAEYQERRDLLTERTREVATERTRLREEQARLVTAGLELEERERAARAAAAEPAAPAAPVAAVVRTKPPADAFQDPAPAAPRSAIDEWWAKQLGSPLEAA